MRLPQLTIAAAALLISTHATAQEWSDYTSRQDRFSVNFPAPPTIREFTYVSWRDARLPARVYTVERGAERYSVTFVDYTVAERVHAERAKSCPPGRTAFALAMTRWHRVSARWKYDVLGAVDHAASAFLTRGAKVTYFAWATIDRITGRQIHLTNADQSRTFVQIHMHENRLYIIEATVPAQSPEPGLFQQSPQFLDEVGRSRAIHGQLREHVRSAAARGTGSTSAVI